MNTAGKKSRRNITQLPARSGGLKQLTPAQARSWTKKRDGLLACCVSKGAKYFGGSRAKIYTGRLSPGCLRCAAGTYSCVFLTERCNRSCYFCQQDRSAWKHQHFKAKELMNGLMFSSPEGYIRYLAGYGYKGVGFSGGEPFLEFDRLLLYVKKIRRALGGKVYLWAYTNGDLVSEDKLKALAAAGLDELRFDLSARNYDLAPLRLAVRHLPAVTVEIPAIPEDLGTVVSLLPELRALGVKHLNLHQLQYTEQNRRAFRGRGYTAARREGAGQSLVLESEITALKIIKSALGPGPAPAVHYCGGLYKDQVVARTGTARQAGYLAEKKGFSPATGSLTAACLLRTLYWRGGAKEMEAARRRWNREKPGCCSLAGGRLFLHPSLLTHKCLEGKKVTAAYSRFLLKRINSPRAAAESELLSEVGLPNSAVRLLFKGIFLEGRPLKEAAGRLLKTSGQLRPDPRRLKAAAEAFYLGFEGREFTPAGLPAYL